MKQNYILYAGSYAAAEEAGIHGYRLIRGEGGEPRLTEVFAAEECRIRRTWRFPPMAGFYTPLWRT